MKTTAFNHRDYPLNHHGTSGLLPPFSRLFRHSGEQVNSVFIRTQLMGYFNKSVTKPLNILGGYGCWYILFEFSRQLEATECVQTRMNR